MAHKNVFGTEVTTSNVTSSVLNGYSSYKEVN